MNRTRLAVPVMAVTAAAVTFSTAGVANAVNLRVSPALVPTYTCEQVVAGPVDGAGRAVVTGTSCEGSGGAPRHGAFQNAVITDGLAEQWLCAVGSADLPQSVGGSFCRLIA